MYKNFGSIHLHEDSTNVIGHKIIQWGDYTTFGDLSWQMPGVYLRDLGSIGQPSQLSIRGSGSHHIGFLFDGRTINEPLLGIPNFNLFSLEAVHRIEYHTGVRAFLYGQNSTGGIVNIVSQDYSKNRPYSKIRYSEGGYSYLSTDGIFSQNVTQRANLMAGFQRRTSEGRFHNSDYDSWNVRMKLRFLISNRVNLVLSESYNKFRVGLNGGVDLSKTAPGNVFDELRATVRNADSFEEVRRHDATAKLGWLWCEDSSSTSSATLYYSNNVRKYRDEENRPNPNGISIRSDHHSAWYGMKLDQEIKKWGVQISVSGELQEKKITQSPTIPPRSETLLGLSSIVERSFSRVTAAVFGRYEHFRGEHLISYGSEARLVILPFISGFIGYSLSFRTPTMQELYWRNGGLLQQFPIEKEKHRLFEAGIFSHFSGLLEFRGTYFRRRIENAIVAEPSDESTIFPSILVRTIPHEKLEGLEGKIVLNFWRFSGLGALTYLTQEREEREKRIYPKLSLYGEFAYRGEFFEGHLDLKLGVRGKFLTRQYGEQFNPEAMMYVENRTSLLGAGGSADLFLVGRVGKAFVHLLVENITDEKYMLTPFFPMPDRQIRFGVAWEFLD